MRITFDLEPADLEQFEKALARSRRAVESIDEAEVIEAAKYALDRLCAGALPRYIRDRLAIVQRLILMLEDEEWALPHPERASVVEALVYFSDPDDLIGDDVEVIGLLDDAIMIEILLQRERKVLRAWERFRDFRKQLQAASQGISRLEAARRLARRRTVLQRAMRRAEKRSAAT